MPADAAHHDDPVLQGATARRHGAALGDLRAAAAPEARRRGPVLGDLRPAEAVEPRADAPSAPSAPARGASGPAFSPYFLIFFAFLIPDVISIYLGEIRLPPIRLLIVLFCIPAFMAFVARGGGLRSYDVFYLLSVFWTAMCIVINRGAGGVEPAGVFVLESGVLYMIVIVACSSAALLRGAANLLVGTVMVLAVFAVAEAVTYHAFIADLAHRLAGLGGFTVNGDINFRMGLMRARTVFSHPILHGVFCASVFAFAWYLARGPLSRLIRSGLVVAATLAGLSGGGVVTLMPQMLAIGVERATRGVPRRFTMIAVAIAAGLVAVHFGSQSGVYRLAQMFTLDGGSSHYRTLIWEHGIDDVMRNPIFGFRPETWTRLYWMPNTIDNYWLLRAMMGGVPAVAFFFIGLVLMMRAMFAAPDAAISADTAAFRRAWAYGVTGVVLAGATVFFFDKMQPYMGVLMGLGAAACRVAAAERRDVAAPAAQPRRG